MDKQQQTELMNMAEEKAKHLISQLRYEEAYVLQESYCQLKGVWYVDIRVRDMRGPHPGAHAKLRKTISVRLLPDGGMTVHRPTFEDWIN
jgi:hypothetical protein